MSNTDIIRSLQSAMEAKRTPTPYDAPAVVTRIEGGATAWVKIAGSDTETPVKLTIDAKTGDTVQVRVGGGSAWLTGNQTAPPTDDTKADKAMEQANKASGVATNYVTDTKDGIFVHPKNNDADGVRITDAIEILKGGLSFFRAWVENGLAKVRVGKADAGHTIIDSNGMRVYGGDGSKLLANIGYGEGESQSGETEIAPYYIFGAPSNNYHGNYSMLEGYQCKASQFASHAEGNGTEASGFVAHAEGDETVASGDRSHAEGLESEASGINSHAEGCVTVASGDDSHAEGFRTVSSGPGSHAGGCKTIAAGDYQTVIGKYNVEDTNDQYALIVGNGTDDNNRSNAFAVDWDGNIILLGGALPVMIENVTVSVSFAAGTIGTRGAAVSCGSNVKSGYTFIGAFVLDHQNTTAFNVAVVRNASNNGVNLLAYRATGSAVSNASVTVRKVWLNTHLFGT